MAIALILQQVDVGTAVIVVPISPLQSAITSIAMIHLKNVHGITETGKLPTGKLPSNQSIVDKLLSHSTGNMILMPRQNLGGKGQIWIFMYISPKELLGLAFRLPH